MPAFQQEVPSVVRTALSNLENIPRIQNLRICFTSVQKGPPWPFLRQVLFDELFYDLSTSLQEISWYMYIQRAVEASFPKTKRCSIRRNDHFPNFNLVENYWHCKCFSNIEQLLIILLFPVAFYLRNWKKTISRISARCLNPVLCLLLFNLF